MTFCIFYTRSFLNGEHSRGNRFWKVFLFLWNLLNLNGRKCHTEIISYNLMFACFVLLLLLIKPVLVTFFYSSPQKKIQ